MGEKLCLISPDMQELMTDELDGKSTKIVQFGERVTLDCKLEISCLITVQVLLY